jgi:hypothetical protein
MRLQRESGRRNREGIWDARSGRTTSGISPMAGDYVSRVSSTGNGECPGFSDGL